MGLIKRECQYCGSEFETLETYVKRGEGKFCSRRCGCKYKAEPLQNKHKTPNVSCAWCGKEFYRCVGHQKNSRSGLHFCGKAHKDEAQRLGGLKEIHGEHYGTGKSCYRNISFRHYPKVCNRCGWNEYPEVLIVHHKDRNRDNNTKENLEVLCGNCHETDHFLAGDGRFNVCSGQNGEQ